MLTQIWYLVHRVKPRRPLFQTIENILEKLDYIYCCTGCNIGNENKESLKLVFLSPCLATLLDVDDKPAKNALDNFFVR